MIQSVKYVICLLTLVITSFYCPEAMSWTRNMNFESGGVTGSDGFGCAGTTVYWDSSVVQSGTHSARFYHEQGSHCWDAELTCGAMYGSFPESVLCGDELWTRAYYYYPAGWDWGSLDGNAEKKILRFGLRTAEGGYAGGMVSIIGYWNQPNDGEIYASNEPGGYGWPNNFTGVNFPIGRWICLEQYVLFGTTNETARHIIWLDETRVFDSADLPETCNKKTMLNVTDHCNNILFFTHWNGRVRTSQNAYIDNVVITTDRPSKKDAQGNPMIGLAGNLSSIPEDFRIVKK